MNDDVEEDDDDINSSNLLRGLILSSKLSLKVNILFFFKLIIYLFIGCVGSQLRHPGSFVAVSGLPSSCGAPAPEHVGSVVVVCGLSYPAACGILVPQPGMELVSPALQDQFLTTGPPGKSCKYSFLHFMTEELRVTKIKDLELTFRYLEKVSKYVNRSYQAIVRGSSSMCKGL